MPLPENPREWAVKAFSDHRASQYSLYRQYLEGNHNLEYATQKFRQAFGRLFDAFGYNRCANVVDAHADRLRVAGFGSPDDDVRRQARERGQQVDESATTIAQAAKDLWERAHMDIHEGQLAVESFGLGDAYLIVQQHPQTGEVQMWPQLASEMRVHYDPEQPGVIDLAAKMWQDEDTEQMRLNLYFADRIEKYRTVQKQKTVPSDWQAFEPYQPDDDTEWPVRLRVNDTVPVFHFGNNARINSYGTSELRDIIPLQDALNKALMDQMVASEFAAAPQRVILGYDASDPDSQTALENLVTGINRMLAIPADQDGNVPSLAEFSAADMTQYDLVAEKWDIRISRQSKVPVHHLTQTNLATSGRSLRIAEGPFVEKLRDRQLERTPVYADAIRYGLRLEGMEVSASELKVNWESPASMSEEDMWDIAAAKAATGMPLRQILKEMGRDPDEIDAILKAAREERDAAMIDLGTFEGPTPDNDDEDEGVA